MQTSTELTARQREIWSFLLDYVDRHGYPPTVREIGEAVGLASPSTVHAHLANLERAGLLRRDPTKPRALEIVGRARVAAARPAQAEPAELPKLPLLGQIAAGGPLLAEQNVEDEIAVPRRSHGDFLLRVKGDSMIEAGILEGDVVVVQRAQDARNGEIVVALAGDDETADEATVKRVLPRERPRPPPAREQRARADLRRLRPDPRQGRGGVPGAVTTSRRSTGPSSRSSSPCCAERRSSARSAASSSFTTGRSSAAPSAACACTDGLQTAAKPAVQSDLQAG